MTNEEAEELLEKLTEHYKEPVMRASRYCKALEQWQDAVAENKYGGVELSQAIGTTFMAIMKSNMLARLIYQGEQPRTKKCPVHDGHWSGCSFNDEHCCDCQMMENGEYGSNVTGWLPETKDE